MEKNIKAEFEQLARNGCLDKIQKAIKEGLVDKDGDSAVNALYWAVANRHHQCVQALVGWGVNVNQSAMVTSATALHAAIEHGATEFVDDFVKRGACPLSKDARGVTPFHQAAEKGNAEALRIFIAQGVDVHACNEGYQAIHYAAWAGQLNCVKLLSEHGADINSRVDRYETPLQLSLEHKHVNVADYLISISGNSKILDDLMDWTEIKDHDVKKFAASYIEQKRLDLAVSSFERNEPLAF